MLSSSGDVTKGVEILSDYIRLRSSEMRVEMSEVEAYLPMHLIYTYGTDVSGCPVVYIHIQRVVGSEISEEDLEKLFYFQLGHIESQFLYRGKVETWTAVIDLANTGLKKMPMD
jgi:hypothetical protein